MYCEEKSSSTRHHARKGYIYCSPTFQITLKFMELWKWHTTLTLVTGIELKVGQGTLYIFSFSSLEKKKCTYSNFFYVLYFFLLHSIAYKMQILTQLKIIMTLYPTCSIHSNNSITYQQYGISVTFLIHWPYTTFLISHWSLFVDTF